jgi:hypothetical protein
MGLVYWTMYSLLNVPAHWLLAAAIRGPRLADFPSEVLLQPVDARRVCQKTSVLILVAQ